MSDSLDILIPARCEQFLSRTIDDVLSNIRGDTRIICVLDGAWANPVINDHPRVTLVHLTESIGQRAATNLACRISRAKYVAKMDAHVSVAEGFDVQLMKDIEPDMTIVPRLYNLHVFDWVCKCGERIYQGPTPGPCAKCGGTYEREMIWKPRLNRMSDFMRFDTELKFGYWREFKKRPEAQGDIVPTMSTLGAFWMLERRRYRKLNICDESWGSWGQQGSEVSMKSWLSGGRLMTSRRTWYSHLFRTQGGDFGFPFPITGKQVDHARKTCKNIFLNNAWPGQIHPLSWLIEKFAPCPDWHDPSGSTVLELVRVAGEKFGFVNSLAKNAPPFIGTLPVPVHHGCPLQ